MRSLCVPLLLCAGLLFGPLPLEAAGTANTPETAPGGEEQEVARPASLEETMIFARNLLESGQLDAAEAIYETLLQSPRPEVEHEARFQMGMIRLLQGRYRQAITFFREILHERPDMARVRLELARAYFMDKNYEDATFQFELVKGGDLPPNVLANVDRFLDAIRHQKNWSFDFSISPVSDTNISQASGGSQECITYIFGTEAYLLCRPLEQKASGYGLSAGVSAEYYPRFSEDWGLRASLGFDGLVYEQNDYNDHILSTALGPRYLWESGEASLQATVGKRWLGDQEYSEDLGVRFDARQIYNRLLLDFVASYQVNRYADDYVNSVLKGPSWNTGVQARYILTNQTFLQAGVLFMSEETKDRAYANSGLRYSLGAYHAFPYGFSLYAEGSMTKLDYQGEQMYITQDYLLDAVKRKDTIWQVGVSLSNSIFERFGLTPSLRYSYTKRESNIWTREYDRHRVNFYINYQF